MALKQITLPDFLTEAQIKRCVLLWKQYNKEKKSLNSYARTICHEIIQPNIKEINRKLGQKNDPMYLAYAIEYVMMRGNL